MNQYLFLIFFVSYHAISFTQEIDGKSLDKLCPVNSMSTRVIEQPWQKDPYSEVYCFKAKCESGEEKYSFKKCFRAQAEENTFRFSYSTLRTTKNRSDFHDSGYDMIIYGDDPCYEECRPIEVKSFLGLRKKKLLGVARKECRQCLATEDVSEDMPLKVTGVDKLLYPGTKCFMLCRQLKGPFQKLKVFSDECKACVGLDGKVGESFNFLLDRDQNCYEIPTNEKVIRKVSINLCNKRPDLIRTFIVREKISFFQSLIKGEEPRCLEVDEITRGKKFLREISDNFCTQDSVNDTERGNTPKRNLSPTERSNPNKATQQ